VPRVLAPLISDGLVVEGIGRVPGRPRRVKVYRLTDKGAGSASAIFERAKEEPLSWAGPEGALREEKLVDASRRLNDELSTLKRPPLPMSVLLSTSGKLRWNELLWLSASMGSGTSKGYCIPRGYTISTAPKPPFKLVGRAKELGMLDRLLKEDRFAVVTGAAGMGKRTLIVGHANLRGLRVLWLERGPSDELCMDEGSYDLLVLNGPGEMDLSVVLMSGGELDIKDPRDGSWPEHLRSPPLVLLVEGEHRVKGSPIELKGLPLDIFVNSCVEAGLPVALSRAFHSACGGSPSALTYVRGLPREELASLSSIERDDAVLRLLLGSKGSGPGHGPDNVSKD
jgi:hypothetical protein